MRGLRVGDYVEQNGDGVVLRVASYEPASDRFGCMPLLGESESQGCLQAPSELTRVPRSQVAGLRGDCGIARGEVWADGYNAERLGRLFDRVAVEGEFRADGNGDDGYWAFTPRGHDTIDANEAAAEQAAELVRLYADCACDDATSPGLQ